MRTILDPNDLSIPFFDDIASKGIFETISNELLIARSLKELNSNHPVMQLLYDREINLLERYRDKICEWDFTRANHMVKVINVQMNELREEKETLL